MTTTTADPTTAPSGPKVGFRGDVDGVRAVAIVLVVSYHVGLTPFRGGFVGVDVFFVISGFLITRRLVHEADTTERISLTTFWARRIRRLVPALGLLVAATLVVGLVVMPIFDRADLAKQGGAAALYVSNILFAGQSQNYFAADVKSSPFLHTWSLGVEEQFYLVWPILVALVCTAVSRARRTQVASRRQVLVVVFGAVFVVSFGYNLWLTNQGSPWSFYGLPTRAWEFAVAGQLAVVPLPVGLRERATRGVLALAGLLVLLVALAVIRDTTPYPGAWAMLPVAATALLIMAGETGDGREAPTAVSAALATAPMQWLGRVSYSWYLWHWPAIVLLPLAIDSDTTTTKVVAALGALVIAWLAYSYYETPIRFSPLIARSNVRTYAVGIVITVVVLLLAFGVSTRAPKATVAQPTASGDLVVTQPGSTPRERMASAVGQYRDETNSACPVNAVKTPRGDDYCIGGDISSAHSILLIGDSHAGQWRSVVDAVARQKHLKLLVREHSGCPVGRIGVTDSNLTTLPEICRLQQDGDLRILDDLKPDAMLVAMWSGVPGRVVADDGSSVDAAGAAAIWKQGTEAFVSAALAKNIAVAWILDEPTMPIDPAACVAEKDAAAPCDVSFAKAVASAAPLLAVERQLVDAHHLPSLDMTAIVCDAVACHQEIDGVLVYVDGHHLSEAFANKQRPHIEQLVGQLVH